MPQQDFILPWNAQITFLDNTLKNTVHLNRMGNKRSTTEEDISSIVSKAIYSAYRYNTDMDDQELADLASERESKIS